MVSEKLIYIWKVRAKQGDQFAIDRLKELGIEEEADQPQVVSNQYLRKRNPYKTRKNYIHFIGLRIDDNLFNKLTDKSKNENLSLSDLIRKILNLNLEVQNVQ